MEMTPALIILGGAAYIALALWFRITPRARVVVALVVGAMVAGWLADAVRWTFNKITGLISGPLGSLIGQNPRSVAGALGSVIVLVLGVVIVIFLRGRHGRAGSLAHLALVAALLLPLFATGLREVLSSVTA